MKANFLNFAGDQSAAVLKEKMLICIDRMWCREAFMGMEVAGAETQSKLCKEVKLRILSKVGHTVTS